MCERSIPAKQDYDRHVAKCKNVIGLKINKIMFHEIKIALSTYNKLQLNADTY